VAVRVNVLARNLEATSGFTDTKVYDMGIAGTVTPGGAYKRHVYNAVIRIVNPSSRRE
jgi:type IV pilus assembly protein PilW